MAGISRNLNKKDLFNELQTALEEDKKYWITNDAKLRAVATAKDYDEFRETVAAAHLTPVSKQDFAKNARTWNMAVRDTTSQKK